jgi:hypothetical protein
MERKSHNLTGKKGIPYFFSLEFKEVYGLSPIEGEN